MVLDYVGDCLACLIATTSMLRLLRLLRLLRNRSPSATRAHFDILPYFTQLYVTECGKKSTYLIHYNIHIYNL